MTEVVAYEQSHFDALELHDCHTKESYGPPSRPAITFLDGGKPVAIVGAFQVVPGVAHLWANVSKNVNIRFAKTAKIVLDNFLYANGLRRAQMTIRRDYKAGMRFARFLGFEPEALMAKYGQDGSDYWLYARVTQ